MLRIIFVFIFTQLALIPILLVTSFAVESKEAVPVVESAEQSEEDIMKDINEFLTIEKDKIDGFKEEDVKVDIESLGLDNVDQEEGKATIAPTEIKEEPLKDVLELEKVDVKEVEKTETNEQEPKTIQEEIKEPVNIEEIPLPLPSKFDPIDLQEGEETNNPIKKEDENKQIEEKKTPVIKSVEAEKPVTQKKKKEEFEVKEKDEATPFPTPPQKALIIDPTDHQKTDVSKVGDEKKKEEVKQVEEKPAAQKVSDTKVEEQEKEVITLPKKEKVEVGIFKKSKSSDKPLQKLNPKTTKAVNRIQKFINNTKNKISNKTEQLITNESKKTKKEEKTLKKQKNKPKKKEKPTKNTNNEDLQDIKLKKLNQLRKQYLIKIDSKESIAIQDRKYEDFSDDNIKIIPKRREINKFSRYKIPAPPILDRYRTSDNVHIPPVLSDKEKVAILFNAISAKDDVSYFKSAYEDVGISNVKNSSGDTLLTYAMLLQRHSIVASILSLGANPNLPNSLGYTPLGIAIEVGDATSLKLLINNNADIDYIDAFGRTYLMHAARTGFLPAVQMLIARGLDVNAMDKDGFTALSIAYRHKKNVIIKYLLRHGAKTWVEKPYNSSSQSLIKELENRWKN